LTAEGRPYEKKGPHERNHVRPTAEKRGNKPMLKRLTLTGLK